MGKRLKYTNGRRLVDDVIGMSTKMPMAGFSGDLDLQRLAKFRRLTKPKIAWNVLFLKAYGVVCKEMPELRQGFVSFPWAHIYEHKYVIGMMTIAREYEGEERLFFARFNRPDEASLLELQEKYDYYRRAPVEEIRQFRHQITFAKFPWPIRRFAWWSLYNVWPQKRASHMGTFGMSFSGYKGFYGSKHLGPNSTTIGVDPLPRKGIARTLITFDHRIIDGTPVTKVMQKVHHQLNTSVREELAEIAEVHPETAEPLNEQELIEMKKKQRTRRIESNRKRKAA